MAENNAASEAKQVLETNGNDGFLLHQDNLKSILLADDVMNKPVVVISVAGAFRKGKSFLLDMMLRYLTASDKSNWINERSQQGFPWRSGYIRHTTGILMWSQPIPVTLPDGTEAVIVLMDTQGTFDDQSTVEESSTVFALSTLLSSLQIYNISGNLQNDDLEHLQLFTEYGRMVLEDGRNGRPFQSLLFLIRDWQFVEQQPLGSEGGDEIIKEWLNQSTRKQELKKVRKHIRDCFSEINGFLLPHPGSQVAKTAFTGSSDEMDPTFVAQLNHLMPKILAPENLTVKTIAGSSVTASKLFTFFDIYTKLFQSDKLPKPKNIMQATAEANNMTAVQEAKTQYIQEMERLISDDQPSLDSEQFRGKHKEAEKKVVKTFDDCKKMGDQEMLASFRKQLEEGIEEWFKFADRANKIKREKERYDAERHNTELVSACKMTYIMEMESVAGEGTRFAPLNDMKNSHEKAEQKAMDQFDTERIPFDGNEKDNRWKLTQEINMQFHQMKMHNTLKTNQKTLLAAEENLKAVNLAKNNYNAVMTEVTTKVLTSDELKEKHKLALKAAVETFEILKKGDESIAAIYLESMKHDLYFDMKSFERANDLKIAMAKIESELKKMKQQAEEEKKPKTTQDETKEDKGSSCTIM